MIADVMREANSRMKGAIASLESDLGAFRTGRASTKLVEHLRVEQYGVEMQLNQMATISVPEPQQLAIRPYDRSALSAIEKAIMKSELGIMPNNDGQVIRLNIPRLTCLLYTSDAADERSSVDLGGRRIIKKKNKKMIGDTRQT